MKNSNVSLIELPVSTFILGINIKVKNPTVSIKAFYPKNVRQLRTKADKREIKNFPKLPSATSFIRETLDAILLGV